jgi:hypothetical protein
MPNLINSDLPGIEQSKIDVPRLFWTVTVFTNCAAEFKPGGSNNFH